MSTIRTVYQALNQIKEQVKFFDENGRHVSMRDTSNKFVKMIPAHVILNGAETEEQTLRIAAKLQEIKTLLESLGGIADIETENGVSYNFFNKRGKHSFSFDIVRHNLKASQLSEDTQVYFEFFFTVAQ